MHAHGIQYGFLVGLRKQLFALTDGNYRCLACFFQQVMKLKILEAFKSLE